MWRTLGIFLQFLMVSTACGVLVAGLLMPWALGAAKSAEKGAEVVENLPLDLEVPPLPERSVVRMANGEVLAMFWEENRIAVPLSEVSQMMQDAQVAIEDHRFFEHGAMDTRGTLRAVVRNGTTDNMQGGSSLTQQYIKMVRVQRAKLAGDEAGIVAAQAGTVERKTIEMRHALALEQKLSKPEILERYLNIAYFGDGVYGVETAARHFFGVHAKDLDLAQSAMLAGLVQNPVATDPATAPQAAVERRNVVLDRMVAVGMVSAEAARTAKQEGYDPTSIRRFPNGCVGTRYPFICDYVRRSVVTMPSLGATPQERLHRLNRGGLVVDIGVEPQVQDAAQAAVMDAVSPRDPVIATMTMVEPGTGRILAMAQNRHVMGKNASQGETYFNHAVGGPGSGVDMGGAEGYQAGSTFKVFTAATALEQGISPGLALDAPRSREFGGQQFSGCDGTFTLPGSWRVSNSTGVNGRMDLRRATAWSVNTYYVQLEQRVGVCESASMAQRAGIRLSSGADIVQAFHDKPSFVLGSAEVTPLSVAEAYATFAARGLYCPSVVVDAIADRRGQVLEVPRSDCEQVMRPEVADRVTDLLVGTMAATGRPATIPGGMPQAGKTGTIDDNQAVWFAGYTPSVSGAAMIAIDKTHAWWQSDDYQRFGWSRPRLKQITLPDSGRSVDGSGGGDAGRLIYAPAMAAYLDGKPARPFGEPR